MAEKLKSLPGIFHGKLILVGAVIALVWANIDHHSYHEIVDHSIGDLPDWLGHKHLSMHFLSNELLMCFFFLVAAAEIREALLPGGPLAGAKKAALPVVATLGGVAGPALTFVVLAGFVGTDGLSDGWVIPTATDIAFSLLIALAIFPSRVIEGKEVRLAAVTFLLTVAVVDDGIGLVLIPLKYSGGVDWAGLGICLAVVLGATYLLKGFGAKSWVTYFVVAGIPSWMVFLHFGVEPALALVPIVVFMPHAETDLGFFRKEEFERHDALSELKHWLEPKMDYVLLVFGFANAGVAVDTFGEPTVVVLVALIVGKVVGITSFAWVGTRAGLQLPDGMYFRDIPVLGAIAGIGFTVSLFVAGIAFTGELADSAKLGAAISLPVGTVAAFGLARLLRAGRYSGETELQEVLDLDSEPRWMKV